MEGKTGTSWIYELSKADAVSLCERFSLSSEGTLDELRAKLREYCRNLQAGEASAPTSEQSVLDKFFRLLESMRFKETPCGDAAEWTKLAIRKGLSFSGEETESVVSFIERCEEFQVFNEVPEAAMCRLAPEILKGKALQWFRVNRESIDSFNTLKERLRETYQPANYDLRLRKDMYVRTQGAGETINEFLTCMAAMNRRLTIPLTENELVGLAYGNLHPEYLAHISSGPFHTMRELLLHGRGIEEQKARIESYRPPPNPLDMVDSEFGFERKKSKILPTSSVSAITSLDENKCLEAKCWNCDARDHFFRDCNKPLSRFCHR